MPGWTRPSTSRRCNCARSAQGSWSRPTWCGRWAGSGSPISCPTSRFVSRPPGSFDAGRTAACCLSSRWAKSASACTARTATSPTGPTCWACCSRHCRHRCCAWTTAASRCSQDEHEAALTFVSADGGRTTVTADVVIAADGIHSAVRQTVAPQIDVRFSGLCAFRCLVPADKAPPMALRPVQTLWLGPGRHFVHYPISGGRLVNVVAIVPAGSWRTESWTADGEISDLSGAVRRLGRPCAAADRVGQQHQTLGPVRPRSARTMDRGSHRPAGRCGPRDAAVLRAGRGAGDRGRVRARRVPEGRDRGRRRMRCGATRRSAGREPARCR